MAQQQTLENDIKSFDELRQEVIARGLCCRCGGCASFCSANDMNALEFNRMDDPLLFAEENCLKCGICYLICPQIKVLDKEVREKFGWQRPIGIYHEITSACTTEPEVSSVCTDGGVVTSILRFALKKHWINGALVSRKTGPFTRAPFLATNPDELFDTAGAGFDEVQHLGQFGKDYSTYCPTIQEIKKIGQLRLDRVAVVGTPCQIYTIRKMQALNIVPADSIVFTVGLFCMENFSFNSESIKVLEKKLGMKIGDIIKLNIKDDIILTTTDGQTHHLPFEALDDVVRPACMACSDFANDFADISVGGLGSPDGYTTTVVRTSIGQKFYNGAKNGRVLEELSFPGMEKAGHHRTELAAKIAAFARRKKKRAQSTLRTLVRHN